MNEERLVTLAVLSIERELSQSLNPLGPIIELLRNALCLN